MSILGNNSSGGGGSVTFGLNQQTGTTYAIIDSDNAKVVEMSNASANTVTLNTSVAVDTRVDIIQTGAGATTIVAGGGATVTTDETLALRKQGSSITAYKIDATTWRVVGDLEPLIDPSSVAIETESGTTYTLAASDANAYINFTNASAITVTVPLNSSVAIPIGFTTHLCQKAAGQITVAGAGGVTVNYVASGTLKAKERYALISLVKVGTDEWDLQGLLEGAA